MQEMEETWVWSLGREDPLEEGMATHSSVLAWRIPWIDEPGGLPSMGSQGVRRDWSNLAHSTVPHSVLEMAWGQEQMGYNERKFMGWQSSGRSRQVGRKKPRGRSPRLSFKKKFYWCAVASECCVNFCCTGEWLSYTHIYTFSYSFPFGFITDTEYSSLWSTVGPCCPSILYILLCTIILCLWVWGSGASLGDIRNVS